MTREQHVSVIMDLEGREFRLLRRLLLEGSLLLLDKVYVHWHIQHLVRPPARQALTRVPRVELVRVHSCLASGCLSGWVLEQRRAGHAGVGTLR